MLVQQHLESSCCATHCFSYRVKAHCIDIALQAGFYFRNLAFQAYVDTSWSDFREGGNARFPAHQRMLLDADVIRYLAAGHSGLAAVTGRADADEGNLAAAAPPLISRASCASAGSIEDRALEHKCTGAREESDKHQPDLVEHQAEAGQARLSGASNLAGQQRDACAHESGLEAVQRAFDRAASQQTQQRLAV